MEGAMRVILCDDNLTIRAIKTSTDGTGRKLLEVNKQSGKIAMKDGMRIITHYWNPQTNESKSTDEYNDELHKGFITCYEREYETNIENVRIHERRNSFYIKLLRLSTSTDERLLSSRYKSLVQILSDIRPSVISYKPKKEESLRRSLEASRQVIKRKFALHEYEYNIIIADRKLGAEVYKELSKVAEKEYENDTLYIKGFSASRKRGTTIKLYDIQKKHGIGEEKTYKIELTFRSNVFYKYNIDISDMVTQESITDLLLLEVLSELLGLKGGSALSVVIKHINSDNVLARVIRLEQGQRALEQGQRALEQEAKAMRAIEQRVREIEKKLSERA